jgi:hypothetical protein
MVIARYKENSPDSRIGKYYKYSVEIFVLLGAQGKRVCIGGFNCKDEAELKSATDTVDYLVKGDAEGE